MTEEAVPAILFVCLGNICRSPLAEAAFRLVAEREGLKIQIDSAGTGDWHVGKPPDRRAQAIAARHGAEIVGYRARQITDEDYRRFTHIFALDHQNLADVVARAPVNAAATIGLLLDVVPGRKGQAVADPYFGDEHGFEVAWRDVTEAADALARWFTR